MAARIGRRGVSIRRADYWLDEAIIPNALRAASTFQSAGRIIGWMKAGNADWVRRVRWFQSAGRIIGWMKRLLHRSAATVCSGFNPPGGLLVG